MDQLRVFITGATGLLGSTLLRTGPTNVLLGASYHKNQLVPDVNCQYYYLNLSDQKSVFSALSAFKPDVVIHTAGIASPDYCDKHKDESWEINVTGTEHIVNFLKRVHCKLVFITTNGVYDGKNPLYAEESKPHPIDWYGKTKYEGENITRRSGLTYLIIRLMTMYGWNNPFERKNPVTWQLDEIQNGKEIRVVTDMYNNMLYAEEAARAIWRAVSSEESNTNFNIAGKDCISRYDFALLVAKIFSQDTAKITPVTLSYFSGMVGRPANTCFDTTRMRKILKLDPETSLQGLAHMEEHRYKAWRKLE